MANIPRAKHHHAKAGKALAAGDAKMAAKHLGNALAAMRNAAPQGMPPQPADDEGAEMEAPPAPMFGKGPMPSAKPNALRAKLAGMKTSPTPSSSTAY